MRAFNRTLVASAVLAVLGASAGAAAPIIYPAKNQSPQQQQKDEGECAAWAKQNTGIDPAVVAATTAPPPPAAAPPPPPPPQQSGARARGAVRGAAAGAVVGEIANDDAGKGAATGAAVGVVAAGSRQRREQAAHQQQAAAQQQQSAQQQQAAQQQAEADKQQKMSTYNRAYGACLEGRGYTLK